MFSEFLKGTQQWRFRRCRAETGFKLLGACSRAKTYNSFGPPENDIFWGERRQELRLRFSGAVSSFAISLPNAKVPCFRKRSAFLINQKKRAA